MFAVCSCDTIRTLNLFSEVFAMPVRMLLFAYPALALTSVSKLHFDSVGQTIFIFELLAEKSSCCRIVA